MKSAFNDDGGAAAPVYDIVISAQTLQNIQQYKSDIIDNRVRPGDRLRQALSETGVPLGNLPTEDFIQALLATKQPLIFAESQIRGDGTDWNHRELALLGDINITMDAKAYDNGVWKISDAAFREHRPPLDVKLMFTPGALLGVGEDFDGQSPDYAEVVSHGSIDQEKYNALVERRLLPLLAHANACAGADGKPAVVTLPGIGCGAFAGDFRGEMGAHLNIALQTMLEKHAAKLPHVAMVYFDPFAEGANEEHVFDKLKYRVRPAVRNGYRSQLRAPQDYAEKGDDFSGAKLYKIVAWDHASYPGNDFFGNSRATDDGVSAAATNSMELVTGIRGSYAKGQYRPPAAYASWEEVVEKNNIRLLAKENVKIVTAGADYQALAQHEKPANGPAPRVANKGIR